MIAKKKTWAPPGGKEQVIAEIEKFHGNLSVVAKSFQISRNTIAKYVANHADVKKCLEQAREAMLDNAESKLYSEVLNGNMTAIIFFLKTQGKNRGYCERQEIVGKNGDRFVINLKWPESEED